MKKLIVYILCVAICVGFPNISYANGNIDSTSQSADDVISLNEASDVSITSENEEEQVTNGAVLNGKEDASLFDEPDDVQKVEEKNKIEEVETKALTPEERMDVLAQENRNVIQDGVVLLKSTLDSQMVLGVVSGKNQNGTKVQLWDINMSGYQQWRVMHDEKGYLTFINVNSGKALNVANGSKKTGTDLQLYTSNQSKAQKWIAIPDNEGIKIVSALDEKLVMDASGGQSKSGTKLQIWSDNGTKAQRWICKSLKEIYMSLDNKASMEQKTIQDGVYAISSGTNVRKVLDVQNESTANLANVQTFESKGIACQKWKVTHDKNGYIIFQNVRSGKVLDVANAFAASGTNVGQYQFNGSLAQKWIVEQDGMGGYRILSALAEDLCLDVSGGTAKNNTNIQVYRKNNTKAQSFTFYNTDAKVPTCENLGLDDQWYEIVSVANEKLAVDVSGAADNDGANIQLYNRNDTYAQLFKFVYRDGYYQIVCAQTDKAIQMAASDVVPGTNIHQWAVKNGDKNQLFSIRVNEDGTYTFLNVATGLAMDVSGGSQKSGANIQGYSDNQANAQKYILKKRTNLLSEGIFSIYTGISSSKYIDVSAASRTDGANIQIWTGNGSLAQKWKISLVKGKENTYSIESLVSGKYLAADRDGNVRQRTKNSRTNQNWIPTISQGYIIFKNEENGRVLDVSGASNRNGANIQTYSMNGTRAQKFKLHSTPVLENGTYVIRSEKNRQYALDVSAGSRKRGSNIQIWSNNNSGAQKWKVSRQADGTYLIENARSKKLLDVLNAKNVSGTNVQQWYSNGSYAQRWKIEYCGNGQFKIVSALDKSLVLDICGGNTYNGANVQIYKDNGTMAQRFSFEPTSYVQEPVDLHVPCYMQFPELPTGCESVALTNALNYYGYGLSKTTMADCYIPRSNSNFVTAFWGNPHSSRGNCCSAPAITNAANQFLAPRFAPQRAYDVTGVPFQNLLNYLDDEQPVIIWTSVYQAAIGPCYASQWYNGRLYQTFTNSHTVVLQGYDKSRGVVYLVDSISGYLTVSEQWISYLYAARGSQAVVIG